ncbi:MAG: metalloregulator ArsR/SmtB family transcription factor, partial [Solirubrobacterales bacterium]|nr:metalloregulator ArsR/SmtB family transcription factor [Solirubrobacterales bacterium]
MTMPSESRTNDGRDQAEDRVFKALADPTRRHLLDRLFERAGRSLTELESELQMTRFGVMKHLRVLEEAGLVVARRSGREKLHYLNPVPIRLIHDRWIDKYTEPRVAALSDLKSRLEGDPMGTIAEPATAQVYPMFIRATPEQVWEAITDPDLVQQYFYGVRVEIVDGRRRVHGPDGELWGEDPVTECDPPRRLVHGWRSTYDPELADEPESRVSWTIESQGEHGSRLTLVHDELERSPKTAASVAG